MFDCCKNHCTVSVTRVSSHGYFCNLRSVCPLLHLGYVWAHNPSQFVLFSELGISENIPNVCCIRSGHYLCFVSRKKTSQSHVTPKNRSFCGFWWDFNRFLRALVFSGTNI
jgi:hypothetical protein